MESASKKPRMDEPKLVADDVELIKVVSGPRFAQFEWKFLLSYYVVELTISSKHFQVLKWNAQMYHLELDPEDNVAILRYQIYKETLVKPERQKILNLKGKDGLLMAEIFSISNFLNSISHFSKESRRYHKASRSRHQGRQATANDRFTRSRHWERQRTSR